MADISAEITAFKNAVYGEDVRDAMVSLANKLNTVITNAVTSIDTEISQLSQYDNVVTHLKRLDDYYYGILTVSSSSTHSSNDDRQSCYFPEKSIVRRFASSFNGIDPAPISAYQMYYTLKDLSNNTTTNNVMSAAFVTVPDGFAIIDFGIYIDKTKVTTNGGLLLYGLYRLDGIQKQVSDRLHTTNGVNTNDGYGIWHAGYYVNTTNWSTKTFNPITDSGTSSTEYAWAAVEVSQGDIVIFENYSPGNDSHRSIISVAGEDYETPYAILGCQYKEANGYDRVGFYYCYDKRVKYLILMNYNSYKPHTKAIFKKLNSFEKDLFIRSLYGITYADLLGSFFISDNSHRMDIDDWTMVNSSTFRSTVYIPVRAFDVITVRSETSTDSPILAFWRNTDSEDFPTGIEPYFITSMAGGGSGNIRSEQYIIPENGVIQLSITNRDSISAVPNTIRDMVAFSIKPYQDIQQQNVIGLEFNKEASRFLYAGVDHTDTNPLFRICQISDVHGQAESMKRYENLFNTTSDFLHYCDMVVLTGDILQTNWQSDYKFFTDRPNSGKILLTIGNHDIRDGSGPWSYTENVSITAVYNRFFKDYIDGWNVVTDSNTETPTYWYKDFSDQHIRVVGLDPNMDPINTSTEYEQQLLWFEQVLNSAKTNGLSVIVCQHYPIADGNIVDDDITYIPCNFNEHTNWTTWDISSAYVAKTFITEMVNIVEDFITNGGDFIAYLVGHTHADFVYHLNSHPRQLCIVHTISGVPSTSYRNTSNIWRIAATIYVCNTNLHTIQLIRYGANVGRYGESRISCVIDYQTHDVKSMN